MKPLRLTFVMLAAGALAACATSYGPKSLPPGTTVEAAKTAMGPPTGEYKLPDGGRRVEYARGPMGKHTYMLDFDAQGRLVKWDQVLTEYNFNEIRSGMTANEVWMRIGHTENKRGIGWQKQIVWSYRYDSPFCVWFQIGMDLTESTVIDTAYGPDPACENDRFPF